MRTVSAILATVCLAVPSGALQGPDQPSMEIGREATRLLLAGDATALASKLSPSFMTQMSGQAGLTKFIEQVGTQAGAEQEVLQEVAFLEGGMTSYYRRSRFAQLPDVTIRWVSDQSGLIRGGSVRPSPAPAPSVRLGYQTKASMRLPFNAAPEGSWYVAWGGRDAIHNYHVVATDQRFATDFVVLNGSSPFRGDGSKNEDHYCFGQPIVAPAAGRVVTAVDGVADNSAPGKQNTSQPAGNHVILDHGQNEYSVIAHLREASVAVKSGQTVLAGTELGRCGNSGKSSLPHLHYHLQTSQTYGQGEGLPIRYRRYRANGRLAERSEPIRGQRIVP